MTQTLCAYMPYVIEIYAPNMHPSTQIKYGYFHSFYAPASGQKSLPVAIFVGAVINMHGNPRFFLQKLCFRADKIGADSAPKHAPWNAGLRNRCWLINCCFRLTNTVIVVALHPYWNLPNKPNARHILHRHTRDAYRLNSRRRFIASTNPIRIAVCTNRVDPPPPL